MTTQPSSPEKHSGCLEQARSTWQGRPLPGQEATWLFLQRGGHAEWPRHSEHLPLAIRSCRVCFTSATNTGTCNRHNSTGFVMGPGGALFYRTAALKCHLPTQKLRKTHLKPGLSPTGYPRGCPPPQVLSTQISKIKFISFPGHLSCVPQLRNHPVHHLRVCQTPRPDLDLTALPPTSCRPAHTSAIIFRPVQVVMSSYSLRRGFSARGHFGSPSYTHTHTHIRRHCCLSQLEAGMGPGHY